MTKIYHTHLYGDRSSKNEWLRQHDVLSTNWNELQSQAPFYLLIPQNTDLLSEYEQGWKITDVMPCNSTGILTARDHFTIQMSRGEMWKIIQDFVSLPVETARNKYDLREDVRDWKVDLAQSDLRSSGLKESNILQILYRPFDVRFTYFTGRSRGFHCTPRGDVMKHMLSENLALLTSRMTKGESFAHAQVTNLITEKILMSPKTSNNSFHFPLYLYPDRTELAQERRTNFSPQFLKEITTKLGYTPTPESIFYYIYAILHSPTYRTRYVEFLKIDFPRIPITNNDEFFQQLSSYGEELVALHLMKSSKLDTPITKFEGSSDRLVDASHPKYANGNVIINKKGDGFTGVPEEVWNFYVGGYQVCQKWLKDRKGRILSPEDITHYQRIVVALQETIRLMQQIDEAIPGFPLP